MGCSPSSSLVSCYFWLPYLICFFCLCFFRNCLARSSLCLSTFEICLWKVLWFVQVVVLGFSNRTAPRHAAFEWTQASISCWLALWLKHHFSAKACRTKWNSNGFLAAAIDQNSGTCLACRRSLPDLYEINFKRLAIYQVHSRYLFDGLLHHALKNFCYFATKLVG